MIFVTLMWLFGQLNLVQTTEFDCNSTAIPSANWTCDDFARILEYQGHQLSSGLNCLGYDKLQSPDEAAHEEGVTDHIIVGLKFTHINNLNDFAQVRVWLY